MSSDQLIQTGRLPASSIDRDDLRSGLVVLPIIGVIYLYGGIYILNKKYFYPAVSHIIGLLDEKYTAVVYCSLNMMIYLFIMLYSTLLAQDNLGISTVLGTEAFNLLFVMGWMQFTTRVAAEIDAWIFIKDSTFYLGTLVFAVIYFSFNEVNWWQALIWVIYFFVYALYFQKKNERLRDKIALFFGLKDEDDVFSSEELLKMEKKRYSLEEITEKIPEDYRDNLELDKKIKRQEGALKIQLKDKSKFQIYARFQKVTLLIIFAIQQKNEEEKKMRSQVFREKVDRLYGRTQRKQKSIKPEDNLNGDDETNELHDKKDEEEGLIDRDGKGYPFKDNNDDVPPGTTPNPTSQVDVLNKEGPEENREFGMGLGDGEPGVDGLDIPSNPNLDEMYVFEDDNMSIPNSFGKKIVYFLFFPLNFLYFVVLFYFRKQPNIKTAAFSMAAILLLQAIFTFLIIWWTEIFIEALDIPNEVAGISFTSIGFSISFIVANLRIQTSEKDPNFLTTFEMVGIYKFGFAGAVGWLLSCATEGITAYPNIIQGLQISALIFLGLFLIFVAWIGINKAKVTRTMSIPYAVSYVGFLIASILFLIYYRDQYW